MFTPNLFFQLGSHKLQPDACPEVAFQVLAHYTFLNVTRHLKEYNQMWVFFAFFHWKMRDSSGSIDWISLKFNFDSSVLQSCRKLWLANICMWDILISMGLSAGLYVNYAFILVVGTCWTLPDPAICIHPSISYPYPLSPILGSQGSLWVYPNSLQVKGRGISWTGPSQGHRWTNCLSLTYAFILWRWNYKAYELTLFQAMKMAAELQHCGSISFYSKAVITVTVIH